MTDLPALPASTRSLQLTSSIAVRLGPANTATLLGTIAQDTRVEWRASTMGPGCVAPWYEMAPRGWICGDFVAASDKPPLGVELPRLARGELVPGIFGRMQMKNAPTFVLDSEGALVRSEPLVGSVMVRQWSEKTFGGRPYWKIEPRTERFVPAAAVTPFEPSGFSGVRLGDETGRALPLAFVVPRSGVFAWAETVELDPVPTLDGAAPKAGSTKPERRKVARQTVVSVLNRRQVNSQTLIQINATEWMDVRDLRIAATAPVPESVLVDASERWIDVDTEQGTLVAYEGALPVFATLVTAGARATPTQVGLYRVWKKLAETDMRDLKSEDPYSVATVPWTQFFEPKSGLALHTAYWHDKFGWPRSHGCINLSPRDARWLYFWSDPIAPPGWTMTAGATDAPGSVVRIRAGDNVSELAWIGYGARVAEQRRTNFPAQPR